MIAVDWGTSSLRLYRMADDGQVRERRRSDQGVLACAGRFGDVLAQEIAGWDDTDILLCGMVGGRGGWYEMPYLSCPAGNHALALEIASVPEQIKGYGHVKARNLAAASSRWAALRDQWRSGEREDVRAA